ncbi:NAD(+) synthase [Candidatus Roizmanbacteria bacterium CG02_land_8_20_14_3_00_36_15]|uniref:NH(3)-dependent NAD(+) synthetase n=1 Tax=Candidatus Roizmanbacteria bacterium CG10_big_fil_rev_8_21_14_0_10_36_26 TaxID=1974851 RepID=A0A2M8KMK8_9BACT|nr:MAG: NAD(+) synthase [Candidatus Roizmanbacteria bacterium CG03_land_8_20_14_0_80_36_21]PIV37643.1 MAG: NAD(+) synthase [Candidatus Roizmanbacteria bacterium CG02_land_8_20_14_3_00_36_15]PIY69944.1 MAG: NAD(+) synthase [Candidatus Roizmanbacteria bacterium CG_4_10_14_0_8_um_filter_36_36]PJE61131.1 MAG: NAD(+) synthase [Candidatus Roizmanbacteria bacterium CG10_big_fil_rev_8_21_14_0_10_36_26]
MKILNKSQCKKFVNLAVDKLGKYIKKNNLKGITTGISGGIDSALVAIIGKKSIDRLNNHGYRSSFKYYYLDCQSEEEDLKKAKSLAKKFAFKLEILDLNRWYLNSPLLESIPKNHPKEKIAQGNIKARIRMISLYQTALLNNYIYLDSDDLSEKWMGFWTRHGDEGDVKIIQEVTKTEVYDLGEYLGAPEPILSADPGDGLNVTKESYAHDQLGLKYIYIEYIIGRFISEGFDYNGSFSQLYTEKCQNLIKSISVEIKKPKSTIKKIINQALKTAYKRKYGDYAVNLLPDRKEFGFFEVGRQEYNQKYLKIIG